MAREVVISIWCDLCLSIDDIHTEGKEVAPVTVGNNKARVLALCPEHKEEFFDRFVEALDLGITTDALSAAGERGRPPTRKASSSEIMCPLPDCASQLANSSSLRAHVRNVHHTTMDEVLADGHSLFDPEGNLLDYRPQARNKPKILRTECDFPGCTTVYEYPDNARPAQAIGVHKRMAHGIESVKKGDTQNDPQLEEAIVEDVKKVTPVKKKAAPRRKAS